MVTLVKHEWHSHDRQYAVELDEDLLSEIYPDLDEEEIAEKLQQVADGEIDVEDIVNDAYDNDVEIYWEFQYDDCWTDRKGGYEVTYETGDENSYHSDPAEPDPTHKCTKCRWTGASYQTLTQYVREDGTVIEDYYNSDEESDITKEVCPMCDSDTELTEAGIKEEQERAERKARWAKEAEESDDTTDDEVEDGLEELKREFDTLTANTDSIIVNPMKCTECDWTGDWTETVTDDDGDDTCPVCGKLTVDVEKE